MATSTDYGMAVYNGSGVDVLGAGRFTPKYIGRLKLRLGNVRAPNKMIAALKVVAEDGRELDWADGTRNIPLRDLRVFDPRRTFQPSGTPRGRPIRGDVHEQYSDYPSFRYLFSLYGGSPDGRSRSLPLLPAVIHGWGGGFDREKYDMACLLCRSMISGQDLAAAGYATDPAKKPARYTAADTVNTRGQMTGLPVAVTFRSRALGGGAADGFGQVSYSPSVLQVEMTQNTEIELYFYDLAGVPYQYLARCSTVIRDDDFGLVSLDYEPDTFKYFQPTRVSRRYGVPEKDNLMEMGFISRAEWFFAPNSNGGGVSLRQLSDAIKRGQDESARQRLSRFLHGRGDKPLMYEKYNSGQKPLRLLTNAAAPLTGNQVTARAAPSYGQIEAKIYTVQAGHEYARVANSAQHACALPEAGGNSGSWLGQTAGVQRYSLFEPSLRTVPDSMPTPSDIKNYLGRNRFNGAPWNPTVKFRASEMYQALGFGDYFRPSAPQQSVNDPVLGNPDTLYRINKWVYDKTVGIQTVWNRLFKKDPVVGILPNTNYDPREAANMQKALGEYQHNWQIQEAEREFAIGKTTEELQNDAIVSAALGRQASYLELIHERLDDTLTGKADTFPFFLMPAYRHSDDKMEVLMWVNPNTGRADSGVPEYVPQNWILCEKPE